MEWNLNRWNRRLSLKCLKCNKEIKTKYFRVRDVQEAVIVDLKSSLTSEQIDDELKKLKLF